MRKRRVPSRQDAVEAAIETALQPGRFVRYGACWDFVSGLEQVAGGIEKLARSDGGRAARLYETFLGGCYEKAGEIDDSSGNFGMLVARLYCGWIKARQAAGADPDLTATWLLARMDDDPYGFTYGFEGDAVKVMNRESLAAFGRKAEARLEAESISSEAAASPPRASRRWAEVLRAVYAAQQSVAAYAALCERTELTAQDCVTLAAMLRKRRKPGEALAWVQRGLTLDKQQPHGSTAGHDLARMERELLVMLGRRGDALEQAWAEYREHPNRFSYEELMRFVAKAKRAEWHTKAMEAADRAELGPVIELWLETKEIERLTARLRAAKDAELERLSHHFTEPAAKRLAKPHPDVAARSYRALGMRILNAKKSKYI